MFNKLTFEQFQIMAQQHQRVAVFYEMPGDRLTPINIYEVLHSEMSNGVLLESGIQQADTGRYSFLGLNPIADFQTTSVEQHTDPLNTLRGLIKKFHCATAHPIPGFIGGTVGFISYDAIRIFENIPQQHADNTHFPNLFFRFYDTSIVFDHQEQKIIVSVAVEIKQDADAKQAYQLACKRIEDLIVKMTAGYQQQQSKFIHSDNNFDFEVDISDEDYRQRVRQAKEYIKRGDAFQIVLSRCFQKKITSEPFEIYRALRMTSPAPYMFYFDQGDKIVLGASPEKLVSVQQGQVSINPLAGTRARKVHNDTYLETELLQDEKEVAEHMMLVDLARNDIGAVCKPGTVQVTELLKTKKFSHVIHLASLVKGELKAGLDALEVLRAVFPAGTLSGAPKIRAMEIIDELETSSRGLYGGAICSLDNQGNFDSCIAIRMAVIQNHIATVRAGAGIVFDSDPDKEAQETRQKAQSVMDAIVAAQRGDI